MSGTVNKVILVGNLGRDPEIRYLESGVLLARFSVATEETFTDKKTREKRTITSWHAIVLWRETAAFAEKYLKKGTKIYVEGKLKNRSWTDENKQLHYTTEVIGKEITVLSQPRNTENEATNYPNSIENNTIPPPEVDLSAEPDDELPF